MNKLNNEHLIAELKAKYPYQFSRTCWELPPGWIRVIGILSGLLDEQLENAGFKSEREKSGIFGGWTQLKEKYGGGKFYRVTGEFEMDDVLSDRISSLIRAAEDLSYETCEKCGVLGEIRDDLWWKRTLCDEHYEEESRKEEEEDKES